MWKKLSDCTAHVAKALTEIKMDNMLPLPPVVQNKNQLHAVLAATRVVSPRYLLSFKINLKVT